MVLYGLLVCPGLAAGQDYVTAWCDAHGGTREATLWEPDQDGAPVYAGRVDCLTPTEAVEIERAARWYTAIGQALWYAVHAQCDPGPCRAVVVLIVERPADLRYLRRLRETVGAHALPLDVDVMDLR